METLSNLQLELLRLYSNSISDESLLEIKQLLARYFADKATNAMDKIWEEKGLTEQDMVVWTNEHNRAENRPRFETPNAFFFANQRFWFMITFINY